MQNLRLHRPVRAGKKIGYLRKKTTNLSLAAMKARQSSKIREIGKALISTGFVSLDAQAKVLGLPRSTAWTIRAAEHKGTGISARIICRMLSSAQLPALARVKIMEYAEEKTAGVYGGTKTQRRRFASKLRFYGLDERPKRMAA